MDAKLNTDKGRAIVEGKTAVPFKTMVGLILQRKVLPLFKKWGDEPVIIDSDLLTSIASAPQDNQENRAHLTIVTLGVGVLVCVFGFSIAHVALDFFGISLGNKEYLIIAGVLVGLCLLASILAKLKRQGKDESLTEKMEKVAALLSK